MSFFSLFHWTKYNNRNNWFIWVECAQPRLNLKSLLFSDAAVTKIGIRKKPSGEMQGVLFCLFITSEGLSFLDLLKTCKDIGKTGSGVWAANWSDRCLFIWRSKESYLFSPVSNAFHRFLSVHIINNIVFVKITTPVHRNAFENTSILQLKIPVNVIVKSKLK